MKAILARFVAAAAVLVAGVAANAQGPGMAPPPDPLNLTPDQKTKMTSIQKKYEPEAVKLQAKFRPQIEAIQKKYQAQALALQKQNTPESQKKLQALSLAAKKEVLPIIQKAMKESEPLQNKISKEIEGILDPKQKKLFQQMIAQQKAQQAAQLKQ